MSHLAVPDQPEDPLTRLQVSNFKAAKQMILQLGFQPTWFHLGGSYALLNHITDECNVIRCGIALYGFPSSLVLKSSKLQPVLKVVSKIAQWKYIKPGDFVGYDKTFQATVDMIIAVLPIGYNDGVDRRLSNKGQVFCKPVGLDDFGDKRSKVYDKLPHKVSCQIIGLISMNIMTIELSEAKKVLGSKLPAVGDEIEIFSDDPLFPNSIEQAAKICQTTPYELLVHLHPSTKREVV
jgi:alanine racemase